MNDTSLFWETSSLIHFKSLKRPAKLWSTALKATLTHNHDLWSFTVSELSWYYQGGLYLRRYYQGGWSKDVEFCIAVWAWNVNFWIWAIKSAFSTLSLEIWRLLREARTCHITPSKFRWAETTQVWMGTSLTLQTNQPTNWQPATKQNKLSAKQKMLFQLAPFQTTNDPPDHLLSNLGALKFFLL